MNTKWLLSGIAAVTLLSAPHTLVWAADEIEQEETAAKDSATKPAYLTALKTKYSLTDEQVTAMQAKGINAPQMAITAQFAATSGKTIEDIMKMRLDQKMGWGKIAKELGIPPKEIGQSVASLRRSEKAEANMDKREARKESRKEKTENR